MKYHFGGPTKRRRRSSAGDLIGGQENVSDDTKRLRATVSKEQVSNDLIPKMEAGPSSTNSGSSGKPSGWRSQWTEEEIQELVRLRCQGMSYPSIAKVNTFFPLYPLATIEAEKLTCQTQDPKYLPGRDLNAIQQKFAKLKKVSPYKEQWSRFKDGKEKQEMQAIGHGNTEGDGDENEDDDY